MINFLKYQWLVFFSSVAMILGGIGFGFYKYKTYGSVFNYSVEFTGGTQCILKFSKPVSPADLKETIEKAGWEGVAIRQFSDNNDELIVRVKEFSNDAKGLSEKIRTEVQNHLGQDTSVTVLQSEGVGAAVGSELRWQSVRAVLITLLLLLIYITIRSLSLGFALGAVVALIHDALAMLLVLMIFNREISPYVIVAILAVLGYSINDTIVIFSQIRTNLHKMHGSSLHKIVNTTLNQTLRRTILTSVSTLLAVGSMFVLGGQVLRDNSLTLLVGILFGTYSSIYIASPIMMALYKEQK